MKNNKRTALFSILTIIMLLATVCLVGYYGLVALNPSSAYNLFSPPTRVPTYWPTDTPTPSGPTPIPTWTPTRTPTITPTPGPTNTRTRTPTPSPFPTMQPTPTFPPTATPTPRVTLSPLPFTYEQSLRPSQYGCSWTGVAGHVQDLDNNPLVGYPVHIWGAGIDVVVTSGADARFNTIYGNPAAWEQFFDNKPKVLQIHVQLHDPYREDHLPISEEIVVDMPGYCGAGLGYVVFIQNH